MATLEPLSKGFEVGDIVKCLVSAFQTKEGDLYRVIPASLSGNLNLEPVDTSGNILITPYGSGGRGVPESEFSRFQIVKKGQKMPLEPPGSVEEFQVGDIIQCLETQSSVIAGERFRVTTGNLPLNFANIDGSDLGSGIRGSSSWEKYAIVQKVRLREPTKASDFKPGDIVECLKPGSVTRKGNLYKVIPSGKNKINLSNLNGTPLRTFGTALGGTTGWRRFAIVENYEGGRIMPVTADVQQILDSFGEERRAVRRLTEKAEESLAIAIQDIKKLEERMTPDALRGIIRNYRYGMNNDELNAPGKGDKALTISFDLEVGQQVWLHTVLGLTEWETFISLQTEVLAGAEEDVGLAKFWNGKRILVKRNTKINRFVPIRLYPGEALGSDRNGNAVYVGDRIQLFDESGDFGEVRSYDPSSVGFNVRRDVFSEGKGPFDEGYGEAGGNLWFVAQSQIELLPE